MAPLAGAADAALRTPEEGPAAQRLERLTDDLRAAHRWARRADAPLAVRLSAALHLFAQSRLLDEPLAWAAALPEDDPALDGSGAALVFASAAQRALNAGDRSRALALAERGAAVADHPGERLFPLELLADVLLYSGRLDEARAAAEQMLADALAAGDSHGLVAAQVDLVLARAYAGRVEDAEAVLARAAADLPAAPSDRAWLAYAEGEAVLDRDPPRALAALDRAATLADSVGNRYVGGVARVSACSLRARTGDPAEAVSAFARLIEDWRRQGARSHQVTTLRNLVVLLARTGAAAEAAELVGSVEHDTVAPTFGEEAARLAAARRWATVTLGPEEAARRFAVGSGRSVDDAAVTAVGWLAGLL